MQFNEHYSPNEVERKGRKKISDRISQKVKCSIENMNYLNERELLNTVSQIRSHLDLKEEGELQGCRREPEPTASKSMVLQ